MVYRKHAKILTTSLIFFLFILSLVYMAIAVPQLPTGYYGEITDSNGTLVAGEIVIVKDLSGNIIGESKESNSNGLYSVNVLWDDKETTQDEGVSSGESIKFFVSNEEIKTIVVNEQGTNNNLNLQLSTIIDTDNTRFSPKTNTTTINTSEQTRGTTNISTNSSKNSNLSTGLINNPDDLEGPNSPIKKPSSLNNEASLNNKTEGNESANNPNENQSGFKSGIVVTIIIMIIIAFIAVLYFIIKK